MEPGEAIRLAVVDRHATARRHGGMVGSVADRSARLWCCMSTALSVNELWKSYRLYHERNQYLKAAILKGRRARYEEFWALKGIDFAVPTGSTFGVIGSNGSGKSTLLKTMAGILEPEKGSVHDRGSGVGAARTRCRVPSGADRPGERVPQRCDPRTVEEGDHRPIRRHRRIRRACRLHRHAGEELLVGHVRPPRVRRRRPRRTRRAAHRRGAVGRRRELPTPVRREDRRVPPRRAHDRVRQPRTRRRSSSSARTSRGSTRATSACSARPRR